MGLVTRATHFRL